MSLATALLPKLLTDIAQNNTKSKNHLLHRASTTRERSADHALVSDSYSALSSSRIGTPNKQITFQLDTKQISKQNNGRSISSSRSTAVPSVNRSSRTARLLAKHKTPKSKQASFLQEPTSDNEVRESRRQTQVDAKPIFKENPSRKSVAFSSAALKKPLEKEEKDKILENYTESTLRYLSKMQEEIITLETAFFSSPNQTKEVIFEGLQRIYSGSQAVGLPPLIMRILELYSKIVTAYGDFKKAFQLLKLYKSICSSFNAEARKLKCYRWLATICKERGEHDRAINFIKKQLILSWKLEAQDSEIQAYDSLGIQYYYKGDVEQAKFFHDRMKEGYTEPKNSKFRKTMIAAIETANYAKQIMVMTNHKEDENFKLLISSGEEDISIPFSTTIDEDHKPINSHAPEKPKEYKTKSLFEEKRSLIALKREIQNRQYSPTKEEMDAEETDILGRKQRRKPVKEPRPAFYTDLDAEPKELGQWMIHFVSRSKSKYKLTNKVSDPVQINHMGVNHIITSFHNHKVKRVPSKPIQEKVSAPFLGSKAKAKIIKLLKKCHDEITKHVEYIKRVTLEKLNAIDATTNERNEKDDYARVIDSNILSYLKKPRKSIMVTNLKV